MQKKTLQNKAILSTKALTKRYAGAVGLDDCSIAIPKGSIYGLLGPNGAGKSTLLRMINQIITPDSGTLYFDSNPMTVEDLSRIGYMPEERGLYRQMTVYDQLLYFCKLRNMSSPDAKVAISYWLEKTKMLAVAKKKVKSLSKGMAQKIQFIATVIHSPELLILDEPFSGFDPINAQVIRDYILELNRAGTTILFSSHRMESVEQLCTHIALLHKSRLLFEGNKQTLVSRQKTREILLEIPSDQIELTPDNFPEGTPTQSGTTLYIFPKGVHSREFLLSLPEEMRIIRFQEHIPNMEEMFFSLIKEEDTLQNENIL